MGLNEKVTTGAILIITIVILFSVFTALIPEVQTSGDALNASNYCASVGCFYNATLLEESGGISDPCRQEDFSNTSTQCQASHTVPLASLFSSSGIVIILLMVVLLIMIIRMVLPKKK